MDAAVDHQAREANRQVTGAGMNFRERILRGVDHRGGFGLPHRFEKGDCLAPHLHVDQVGDDLYERGARAAGMS